MARLLPVRRELFPRASARRVGGARARQSPVAAGRRSLSAGSPQRTGSSLTDRPSHAIFVHALLLACGAGRADCPGSTSAISPLLACAALLCFRCCCCYRCRRGSVTPEPSHLTSLLSDSSWSTTERVLSKLFPFPFPPSATTLSLCLSPSLLHTPIHSLSLP